MSLWAGAVPRRQLWTELMGRQPILATAGWAILGLAIIFTTAIAVDPRQINGVSVWVKPAKFAASFCVWLWTLAWAWGELDDRLRHGVLAQLVLWGTLAAAAIELPWITLRAALALPSHFATDPLGQFMYGVMGVAALVLVALAALLGALVLWRPALGAKSPWTLAVGLGLVLGGTLGGLTGAAIGSQGGPYVGGTPSDASAWPPFFWSRDGGDLRVAHFLGIHAMQALPALALLAPRPSAVWLGAAAWTALVMAAAVAGYSGQALTP